MKPKIIEALCKAIAPTTPTDPIERNRVGSLLLTVGKKKGPSITAPELARLVDVRLRQRKDPAGITPEKIVEEIEATLDLVEMCEFMVEVRRRQAGQTQSEMFQCALGTAPTEKEKQINAAIYPMKFTAGLIKMGVPEKRRDEWYWSFFKDKYPLWEWVESGGSKFDSSGSPELRDIPEDEIKAAYDQRKAEGWRYAWLLGNVASQWCRWYEAHKHDPQKLGGINSAKARAAKKKPPVKKTSR
jgi:hypothetical protein